MKEHITIQQLHELLEITKINEKANTRRFDQLLKKLGFSNNAVLSEGQFTLSTLYSIIMKEATYIETKMDTERFEGWDIHIVLQNGFVFQKTYEELVDGLWEVVKHICQETISLK